MPIQRFAPMTKDFATFDCDAHVTEPPLIWERAHEFLTRDELDALKRTIWWDPDGRLRSIKTFGTTVRVELRDPLQPHKELLPIYTDNDIHNVTAYLASLRERR